MQIIRIQSLQEHFLPFTELNRSWKCDKRYPEQAIQRFIILNKTVFAFLGITASLVEKNYEKGLCLTASNFVGAAPLRTPLSGKYYTDIQITSRFKENVSELAYLLKEILEPSYLDIKLLFPSYLRAPYYFDCINYFHSFIKAIYEPWNKFNTVTKIESHPCSSTDWSKYVNKSVNPSYALKFENRKNVLLRDHREWQELVYVLYIAISEFESEKTPLAIKQRYSSLVSTLKNYLYEHRSIKPVQMFHIQTSEPTKIKELKNNANKLLSNDLSNGKAWRIDSAEMFERYVQYVLTQVSKQCGAHVKSNPKFPIKGSFIPAWSLKYLEPDIVIKKADSLYFADAKYKSHMLNTKSSSEVIKETFRSDLHQILAYSSFDRGKDKTAMIIYPCDRFKKIQLTASNPIVNVYTQILLIGLPLTISCLDSAIEQLVKIIRNAPDQATQVGI